MQVAFFRTRACGCHWASGTPHALCFLRAVKFPGKARAPRAAGLLGASGFLHAQANAGQAAVFISGIQSRRKIWPICAGRAQFVSIKTEVSIARERIVSFAKPGRRSSAAAHELAGKNVRHTCWDQCRSSMAQKPFHCEAISPWR